MSNITRYAISGICVVLALSSYLKFLAERDHKMMQYYDGVTVDKVAQGGLISPP